MKKKATLKKLSIQKNQIAHLNNIRGGADPKTGYQCMDASTPTSCFHLTKPITTTK